MSRQRLHGGSEIGTTSDPVAAKPAVDPRVHGPAHGRVDGHVDGHVHGADTPPRSRVQRVVDVVGWPAACYVASRFVMFLGVVFVRFLSERLTVPLVFRQWDGSWYHRIVDRGYPTDLVPLANPRGDFEVRLNAIPFFPGYPLVARAVHTVLPVGPLLALEMVAVLFGLTATICFHRLCIRTLGRDVADRAVLLFVFFPGAWVLGFPYSESMMLTFALLCFLALDREQWVAAGAAAAVATFTRPNAVFLVPACAWVAVVAIRRRGEWRALWAPALAPIGMLAYFTYLWIHTGNFFIWREAEHRAWGERFDFGATTLGFVGDFIRHPFTDHTAALVSVSFVLTLLGLVAIFWAPLSAPLRIFACGVAGLPLISHVLVARPRFVFAAFPIVMAFSALIPKRAMMLVVPVSAALMAFVVVYYGYYSGAGFGFVPP